MRFYWKTDTAPLASHADWRERLEKKNRRPGTSAPTLAAAWAGPLELMGALRQLPQFANLVLEDVKVERESHFDDHGGPRNHDLVAYGRLPKGERVVVCVEAKAGETLGQTVGQYAKAAKAKRENGKPTKAPERLEDLLAKYVPHSRPTEERVGLMRYQLLSALAGTQAEAAGVNAAHAILMVHEFRTDQRPEDKTQSNLAELHRFVTTVFDCEHPGPNGMPWCFEVPAPASTGEKLYIAWAVTDLTKSTLEERTQAANNPGETAA
jgi:hypothetical protein